MDKVNLDKIENEVYQFLDSLYSNNLFPNDSEILTEVKSTSKFLTVKWYFNYHKGDRIYLKDIINELYNEKLWKSSSVHDDNYDKTAEELLEKYSMEEYDKILDDEKNIKANFKERFEEVLTILGLDKEDLKDMDGRYFFTPAKKSFYKKMIKACIKYKDDDRHTNGRDIHNFEEYQCFIEHASNEIKSSPAEEEIKELELLKLNSHLFQIYLVIINEILNEVKENIINDLAEVLKIPSPLAQNKLIESYANILFNNPRFSRWQEDLQNKQFQWEQYEMLLQRKINNNIHIGEFDNPLLESGWDGSLKIIDDKDIERIKKML